jgi:hypothetical protein
METPHTTFPGDDADESAFEGIRSILKDMPRARAPRDFSLRLADRLAREGLTPGVSQSAWTDRARAWRVPLASVAGAAAIFAAYSLLTPVSAPVPMASSSTGVAGTRDLAMGAPPTAEFRSAEPISGPRASAPSTDRAEHARVAHAPARTAGASPAADAPQERRFPDALRQPPRIAPLLDGSNAEEYQQLPVGLGAGAAGSALGAPPPAVVFDSNRSPLMMAPAASALGAAGVQLMMKARVDSNKLKARDSVRPH